jgi:hypothetical protein
LDPRWLISIILLYLALCSLLLGFIPGFLAGSAASGFASFPVLPVILELLTRKFDNIPFHVTNTVLFVASQLFSVFMQTIFGLVMDNSADGGVIVVICIILMLTSTLYFIRYIDNNVDF